jgi:hypothetical protein
MFACMHTLGNACFRACIQIYVDLHDESCICGHNFPEGAAIFKIEELTQKKRVAFYREKNNVYIVMCVVCMSQPTDSTRFFWHGRPHKGEKGARINYFT